MTRKSNHTSVAVGALLGLLMAWLMLAPCFGEPPAYLAKVFTYAGPNAWGTGSGVLVSPTLVLTNWHVVRDGDRSKIRVTLAGLEVDAKFVKRHKQSDLALLKIQPTIIPFIKLGQQNRIGQEVRIFGYKSGIEFRETRGLILRRGRDTIGGPKSLFYVGCRSYAGMSGGPVLDTDNRLVGLLWGSTQESSCVDLKIILEFLK